MNIYLSILCERMAKRLTPSASRSDAECHTFYGSIARVIRRFLFVSLTAFRLRVMRSDAAICVRRWIYCCAV